MVDNTKGQFESAAKALNYGVKLIKDESKYIMFVHQDVVLKSNTWLEDAERILSNISDLGVAGCAGMTDKNRKAGCIIYEEKLWNKPFDQPQKVQTLDECLLIIPREVFTRFQFDEKTFDKWHLYGADYCLSIKKELGLNGYVIPLFIQHNSRNLNLAGLLEERMKLFEKHKKFYKQIYVTCGPVYKSKLQLLSFIENTPQPIRNCFKFLLALRKKFLNKIHQIYNGFGKYNK